MYPEFQQLSQSKQESFWKNNVANATALTVAKMEYSENGNDQAFFLMGDNDWRTWTSKFIQDHYIKDRPLKKIMLPIVNKDIKLISPELCKNYEKLVNHIGVFTHHPETFKLFVMILLFSDSENFPSLKILQKCFLRIIQRRHQAFSHIEENGSAEDILNKFYSSISAVKELAEIVQQYNL